MPYSPCPFSMPRSRRAFSQSTRVGASLGSGKAETNRRCGSAARRAREVKLTGCAECRSARNALQTSANS
eukprot:9818483-Alexandrium_andersonii.AAC.1